MSVRIVTNNEGYGQGTPEAFDTATFANPAAAIAAISSGFLSFTVTSPLTVGATTGSPHSATESVAIAATSIKYIIAL